MLALSGGTALIIVTPTTAITSRPSRAGTKEFAPPTGTIPAQISVGDHEDEGLHGDAADEIACGEAKVAADGGRDRDGELGEAADDREQDHAPERFAQPEIVVELVGGLGEAHAHHPGRSPRRR